MGLFEREKMKTLLKGVAIILVLFASMIPLEFWFRIFVLGRQYETAPMYQSFFYALAPIAIIALAGWGIRRIAKAKLDFT